MGNEALPKGELSVSDANQVNKLLTKITPACRSPQDFHAILDLISYLQNIKINMSAVEFLQATSNTQRNALLSALDHVIAESLKAEKPVLMEGFGIMIVKRSKEKKTYNLGHFAALRTEDILNFDFEKCDHLETDYSATFPDIIKTTDLARRCRARLEPEFSLLWSERYLTRLIRGLFKYVRQQLIRDGQFSGFPSIGQFIALHNRQGRSEKDWFAGADIILINRHRATVATSDPFWFERPVLNDAWELLEAAFGQRLTSVKIELHNELRNLGYDPAELPKEQSNIEVAVFQNRNVHAASTNETLLFCTKNLNNSLPPNSKPELFTEFTWSVQIENVLNEKEWEKYLSLARRIFTLGWILLMSAKHKLLPIGAGIASNLCDGRIGHNGRICYLQAILVNKFTLCPNEALTSQGAFQYLNLLPITHSEYELAEKISARYLLELLELRGLDQVTRLYRKPISLHLAN